MYYLFMEVSSTPMKTVNNFKSIIYNEGNDEKSMTLHSGYLP